MISKIKRLNCKIKHTLSMLEESKKSIVIFFSNTNLTLEKLLNTILDADKIANEM